MSLWLLAQFFEHHLSLHFQFGQASVILQIKTSISIYQCPIVMKNLPCFDWIRMVTTDFWVDVCCFCGCHLDDDADDSRTIHSYQPMDSFSAAAHRDDILKVIDWKFGDFCDNHCRDACHYHRLAMGDCYEFRLPHLPPQSAHPRHGDDPSLIFCCSCFYNFSFL